MAYNIRKLGSSLLAEFGDFCVSLLHEEFWEFFVVLARQSCLIVLSRLLTFVAYIANNMNPDQTASLGEVRSGFIVFTSVRKIKT